MQPEESNTVVEPLELEFEKERLALCEKYYEMEGHWKEGVEKKAHVYFLVLLAFLGATTFKIGSLNSALSLAFTTWPPSAGTVILAVGLVTLLLSAAWTVMSVYKVLKPGQYRRPYPVQLHDRFFSPFAEPKPDSDEASLLKTAASRLAKATDECRDTNSEKSRWLVQAARGFLIAIISSIASLVTFGFLQAAS